MKNIVFLVQKFLRPEQTYLKILVFKEECISSGGIY